MDAGGRVYIEADRDNGDDPALGAFLDLIEADIKRIPHGFRPSMAVFMTA